MISLCINFVPLSMTRVSGGPNFAVQCSRKLLPMHNKR